MSVKTRTQSWVFFMSHPLIYFGAKVSHYWPVAHQVDQTGCPGSCRTILVPVPHPELWNYKCAPSSLGLRTKIFVLASQYFTHKMSPQPCIWNSSIQTQHNKVTQGVSQRAQVTCGLNGHHSVCECKIELCRKNKGKGLGTAQPVECPQYKQDSEKI